MTQALASPNTTAILPTPIVGINGTGAATGAVSPMSAALALDQRYGYRHIRYNANETERDAAQKRQAETWNHARPNSIFLAAIGNHWKPGAWQAVVDMQHYTNSRGFFITLEEIQDRCMQPYDAIGAMRNEATMRAAQGYEWLMMVDNDVYPHRDTLVRLIDRNVSIVAPMVTERASGRALHGPPQKLWTGLQPARWCVLSMLLFRTSVFNATGPEFWNNAIGADEGYHFQKLWHYGHRPYIDTEIRLTVGGDPTYPLSTMRMKKPDADAFWERRQQWLLAPPNREPTNPNDPRRSEHGEYLPFQTGRTPKVVRP